MPVTACRGHTQPRTSNATTRLCSSAMITIARQAQRQAIMPARGVGNPFPVLNLRRSQSRRSRVSAGLSSRFAAVVSSPMVSVVRGWRILQSGQRKKPRICAWRGRLPIYDLSGRLSIGGKAWTARFRDVTSGRFRARRMTHPHRQRLSPSVENRMSPLVPGSQCRGQVAHGGTESSTGGIRLLDDRVGVVDDRDMTA